MFNYKGRVVAVTGASSGLGKQMAEAYAQQGADLVLLARRIERLEASAKEWSEKYGVEVLPVACDVTSKDSIEAAVNAIKEHFGHCEVIVNCAGGERGTGTPLVDYKREDWDFTLNLDLTSVFSVTQAFANFMKEAMGEGKQTYGRVINIASIYGLVGNTAIPTIAYHTSKGAVVNFTRGAAAELATANITVNAICPGYFYTELTTETLNSDYFQAFANQSVPMKRYGKQGELNPAAIFLGAEESSYVTGQVIAVDGGYTCV
ncbi:MAG: SDR family oxidoreductase [Erysipelotrichaceae bacterium]|nr:SDR family oxidoreductase [Erysipelotrichaceae bacterium]